ncbi:MAG TPA: YciI family protein [Acidimicrobiales bacterium]
MPQYAVFLYAPVSDHEGDTDDRAAQERYEKEMGEHNAYSQELQDEGVMHVAFALESYESATSLRASGVTDGPFIESKEVVLGGCVIEASDLDAALAIASRNPILHQGGGVEVRPVQGFVIPERHLT